VGATSWQSKSKLALGYQTEIPNSLITHSKPLVIAEKCIMHTQTPRLFCGEHTNPTALQAFVAIAMTLLISCLKTNATLNNIKGKRSKRF
jgi:hypothetical protein